MTDNKEVNTMAIATAPRPTITSAIDALAELLEARAENYGEAEATQGRAISRERARRLAILFKKAGALNAWQLEALLRHAALLYAAGEGVSLSDNEEPAWDHVHQSEKVEVQRIERVVDALGFWGDEGIGYRSPSHPVDAA
jgi:hypothetical protein